MGRGLEVVSANRRSGIGTGELDRALLANGLVDEFHFWVFVLAAGSA
jgi:hypothetical protein